MKPQVPVDRHSDFAPLADDAHLQTTVLADGGIQAGTQHRLLDGVGQGMDMGLFPRSEERRVGKECRL